MPVPTVKVVVKKPGQSVDSDAALASKRLAKARARHELVPPSPKEILAFQLAFLRRSNLLVYTDDPAVIRAARATIPEPGERVATFMERAFGSRNVDVVFAQFMSLDGRTPMRSIVDENAGRAMKELMALSRRRVKEAVAACEELEKAGKRRLKAAADRARERYAADRQRFGRFPADWLEDRAREAQDLNERALNGDVRDERVIARLRAIAQRARQRAATDGNDGAPLEFVVDELIAAYEGMAQHERQQAQRLKQLEAELAAIRQGKRRASEQPDLVTK